MATILAHIRVHSGRERDFESVARALHADTHARERGVRHYEYWRGAEPGLYYCLLAFDDFNAFLEHQTSPHHESASPRLGALIRAMQLEWVDPIQGASKLPATDTQALPADASDLTRRYHRIFAVQMQDWWDALRKPASS
jgi:quinol monooxygenase YgiN